MKKLIKKVLISKKYRKNQKMKEAAVKSVADEYDYWLG